MVQPLRHPHPPVARPVRPARRTEAATPRALVMLLVLAVLGACLAATISTLAGGVCLVVALTGLAITSLDALAVLLLLASMSLVQPFALGAGHTTLGSAIACGAGLAAALSDAGGQHERAGRAAKSVVLWTVLLGGWTAALAGQHPGLGVSLSQHNLEALAAVVGSAVLVMRSRVRRLWFCRVLVAVMAFFCASYLISLALWLKDGFSSHLVGGLTIRGYSTEPVYFPVTPTSGVTVLHGLRIPRLLGPLREPGLFQAVLIWALFMTDRLGLSRRSLKLLLLAGVLATQSTAGLGILLVVWVLTSVIMSPSSHVRAAVLRQLGGVVVLVAALAVAVFAPAIGVQAKQTANGASIDDRWTNTRAGLVTLVQAPLGRDQTDYPANVAINMLAATTLIGAPGLALGLMLFVRPTWLSSRRRDALATSLPLFLTALVAQPVLDAPAFFVLLMAGLTPLAAAAEVQATDAVGAPHRRSTSRQLQPA